MLRKITSLIVILALALLPAAFAEEAAVRVGALKGPTAMGMVEMMENHADTYDFTLAAAPLMSTMEPAGITTSSPARGG